MVIGSASCFLPPGTHVWQCGEVARLTQIDNGELGIPSFSYSKKKKNKQEVEDMEFPGYWKNCKRNFQGLKKNKVEFPEVIKKVEFPGVLVLDLKISKGCDNKILWSF